MSELAVVEPGQYVVAQVCEIAKMLDMPIPPAWLGIIGRNAKVLINGGFQPEVVVAACWVAVQRGKPQMVQHIAGDLALAGAGRKMGRTEYEVGVSIANDRNRPSLLRERTELLEQRRAQIEAA